MEFDGSEELCSRADELPWSIDCCVNSIIGVSVHVVDGIEARVVGSAVRQSVRIANRDVRWDKACRLPLSMWSDEVCSGGSFARDSEELLQVEVDSLHVWKSLRLGQDEA